MKERFISRVIMTMPIPAGAAATLLTC